MLKIGFVGWRGMVGSVLMERMIQEKDFHDYEAVFFTTSNVGGEGPDVGMGTSELKDAYDLDLLSTLDIAVTCQGSDYTKKVYPDLRKKGWEGYWIDTASALRMDDESIIVLDPVNRKVIDRGLSTGIKSYIGGNCTVSLMLMALGGLFTDNLVEWITSMTYQAASGAGANNMKELLAQMAAIGAINNPDMTAVELDRLIVNEMRGASFPVEYFGAPLAGSLIPWVDAAMESGQTKEEWKGYAETNKILGTRSPIPVDGICVRIGAMRCHSQGITIKLKKNVPLKDLTEMIAEANDWVKIIPNDRESTLKGLSPAAVSGTLAVPVGRIRKMNLGPEYLTVFTVGDQLLWGAAEPIRRILNIIIEHLD